jgi:gluconate 2-dehydrogenase alpha chain
VKRLKPAGAVIAGGGWTGLLMAKEIAMRTGLQVVVLERGPARRLADYAAGMDEVDFNIRLRLMQNIAEETVTHRHSVRDAAVPVRQYGSFHPGTGTGGAGEHWGGVTYRYEPDHFTLATHLREKYGASRLPENLSVQDWGVTYEELEADYWRAEQLIGVCGKAGNLRGKIAASGNIFEAPRSHEYPNPPHPSNYLMSAFHKGALDLGYHPYPVPTATLTQTYRNPDGVTRPACAYCGFCSRYGCMIGAKAQPSNTLMPVLAPRKNFELRNGCWVRRVAMRGGAAEGVVYIDASGEECLQPADIVVLSSWTLNNARLLLLSGIGERYDPGTGKGALGKNLTHQVCAGLQMFFDKPLNSFMGAGGMGTAIGDFEGEGRLGEGMLRGGGFRTQSSGDGPIASFGRIPPGEAKSNWGADWKKASLRWYDRAGSVMFEGDHLAYRHNYVDLDPTYKDKFGDPLLRMTLDWTDHERAQERFAMRIQTGLAKAMGARPGGQLRGVGKRYSVTYYQSTHVQGGAVMGASPETSVVNPWLQHWRVPNLWVLKGSSFPQSGWGNPTLSALALTYRAADALVGRYLKRPGGLA